MKIDGTVKAHVERLAKEHGIVHRRTGLDDLADAITRLSDRDVPVGDQTDDLLVALARAHVITGREMVSLLSRHMDESQETIEIEGEVTEVLPGMGLAHVQSADGTVYGINRKTPGVSFDDLHEGQTLLCTVTSKFDRVLSANSKRDKPSI